MTRESITIGWLYPDLMSTYGDRGNIIVLRNRCLWRNIDVKVEEITLESKFTQLKVCNLLFMGGAQDRQQKIVGNDFLNNKGPVMKEMVEQNIPALYVCAGYQAVGKYYQPFEGEPIPGANILDLVTKHPGDQKKRLIGNIVAKLLFPLELKGQTIVGFENHGGRTTLGPTLTPLAKVVRGGGNNGDDGFEGAFYRNTIGSYFHGPLLPKNPHLADWLITQALMKKYGVEITLTALNDELEVQAHAAIIKQLRS